jgi:hypothetical protein
VRIGTGIVGRRASINHAHIFEEGATLHSRSTSRNSPPTSLQPNQPMTVLHYHYTKPSLPPRNVSFEARRSCPRQRYRLRSQSHQQNLATFPTQRPRPHRSSTRGVHWHDPLPILRVRGHSSREHLVKCQHGDDGHHDDGREDAAAAAVYKFGVWVFVGC